MNGYYSAMENLAGWIGAIGIAVLMIRYAQWRDGDPNQPEME